MRINSELLDAQLENKGSDITPASTNKGLIYHKSTTEPIKVSDGTTVHKVLTDQMYASIADGVETMVAINQSQVTCNYAIGASTSGSFFTSSTSYTDVTNLTVSITTSGKPVEIMLMGDRVSVSGAAAGLVKAVRGSTDTYQTGFLISGTGGSPTLDLPASAFRWIDTPVAGTYTYKIQAMVTSGVGTIALQGLSIFVREL